MMRRSLSCEDAAVSRQILQSVARVAMFVVLGWVLTVWLVYAFFGESDPYPCFFLSEAGLWCPNCGPCGDPVEIVYGLDRSGVPLPNRAVRGGCLMIPESPQWCCLRCLAR